MTSDEWRVVAMIPAAFVLTVVLVPVARRFATARGITDHPKDDRWHRTPTPYLGGVAILVAAAGCAVAAPRWQAQAAVILGGATAVAMVGLVDDLRTLSPLARLAVEAAAAGAVYFAGARTRLFGGPGDFVVTVLWLVVVTNAFNLLDNVDGALGSIAATIALGMTATAVTGGQILVGALAAIVAGACLGFLVYNWHPASIFMGDAGSLFLGFLLGAIGLKLKTADAPFPGVVAVILLVGPALFDTTLVMASRLRAHRPLLVGGTDHTSHRLLQLGIGHQTMTLILIGASACSSGLGVAVARDLVPALPVAVGVGVLALGLLAWLLTMPVYAQDVAAPDAAAAAA